MNLEHIYEEETPVLRPLGAMSMAHSAMAQDFDDRWYISGTAGVLGTDDSRGTSNAGIYGVGVGKMVTSNVSIDVDLDRANTDIDPLPNQTWDLTGLLVTGRYHFIKEGRNLVAFTSLQVSAPKEMTTTVSTVARTCCQTRRWSPSRCKRPC